MWIKLYLNVGHAVEVVCLIFLLFQVFISLCYMEGSEWIIWQLL